MYPAKMFNSMGVFALAMCVKRIKRTTAYINPKLVVKLTHKGRFDRRCGHLEYAFSVGHPNYAEKKFIKACQKAGEPFPVKRVQFKMMPAKKSAKPTARAKRAT